MPQLAFLPITINGWITMAPNLALSKHILIQNMISSKLHTHTQFINARRFTERATITNLQLHFLN
jgi:hypothetical protein